MAKAAFRVEDGIVPGHVDNDLGHSTAKFRHTYMSGNANIGGNANVTGNANITGNLDVDGATTLVNLSAVGPTINLPNFEGGGGGGGGVSSSLAIAFAVALG